MSRSETAFERVSRQLDQIREDLTQREAKVIDDARDLLSSVGDLFYRDTTADERHCPGSFHVCLIDGDDRDVFVVSKAPLSKKEKEELVRRCTTPLAWSLCAGIKVRPTENPHETGSPVYDPHGRYLGAILDLVPAADIAGAPSSKGGAA